jgi:hypothetical protein
LEGLVGVGRVVEVLAFVVVPLGTDNSAPSPGLDRLGVGAEGVVLAATFSVLFIFPLVQLAEVGFLVAFGVLLDTLDVGPRLWWPSRLARNRDTPDRHPQWTGTGSGGAGSPARTTAGRSSWPRRRGTWQR